LATHGDLATTNADLATLIATHGSVGHDYSVGAPTLPVIGANFGSTGVYANYVLLATVAASSSRANLDVENLSGSQLVIIRDDGTAASGAAPVNASLIVLSPGPGGAGSQGGSWTSTTFKGRFQVYGPTAGLEVSIFTD
jgi:hypothetical protein